MRMPKAPLADFSSNAPLKLFFSQGSAEGLGTFQPSLSYSPYVWMRMPFFKVKLPICRLSVEPQKPVSPKGFELKYRELLSENMFERPCE